MRAGNEEFDNNPRIWTLDELTADVAEATEWFRRERMEEPLDDYLQSFDRAMGDVEVLFEGTVDLSQVRQSVGEYLTQPRQLKAFRYLAGPPISEDDLKTLVSSSIAPTTLRRNPQVVDLIVDTVLAGLDRRRFPWVPESRAPNPDEIKAGILATSTLIAEQETATLRRNAAKKAQEESVANALIDSGFCRVVIRLRNVAIVDEGPSRGSFCLEKPLAGRKADLIVRLWDGRVVAIECKVSNSGTNSVKRVLNDAAAKAETWKHRLGEDQVIPAAVLSGVFKAHNLQEAQRRQLSLFWAHRLTDLTDWIESTRR